MPYIPQNQRKKWDVLLKEILKNDLLHEATAGQLNYVITKLLLGGMGPQARYGDFNEAMGVLSCVGLELYRRKIAPYEDGKVKENGDVY